METDRYIQDLKDKVCAVVQKCWNCNFCYSACPNFDSTRGFQAQGPSGMTQALYYAIKWDCLENEDALDLSRDHLCLYHLQRLRADMRQNERGGIAARCTGGRPAASRRNDEGAAAAPAALPGTARQVRQSLRQTAKTENCLDRGPTCAPGDRKGTGRWKICCLSGAPSR